MEIEHQHQVEPQTCGEKSKAFFVEYFVEGQKMDAKAADASDPNATFLTRYRKPIAMLFPALIVHIVWWTLMVKNDWFYLFTETSGSKDKPRYFMSITMIFGSMLAGATAEGGAAVAFPVMTLALGIAPPVARDFSFMIQSVGMVAAAFTILVMRVAVEWHSLTYVTLGGIFGIIFGLEEVAPKLPPAYTKMYFVVIWSSFAVGLYMLNRTHGRKVYDQVPAWEEGVLWRLNDGNVGKWICFNWKAFTLLAFGVLGGIFSAMAGSGIDICSFAALTLLFRVDEKVATPTSVILMGINTSVGFAYRQLGMGGVKEDAWGFLAVCAPIVVFGAPLGSYLGSHFHRLTLATIIYLVDFFQLVGALVVVQPWTTNKTDTPLRLTLSSAGIFVFGMVFFRIIAHLGMKLMGHIESENQLKSVKDVDVIQQEEGRSSSDLK